MTLLLLVGAALAFSGVVLAVGWRHRAHALRRLRTLPTDDAGQGAAGTAPPVIAADGSDAAAVVRSLATLHEATAAQRYVHIDLALQPDLSVAGDPAVWGPVVANIVATAIVNATGGQVLLSARRHDQMVTITVSDDGEQATQAEREGGLRDAMQRIALLGGSITLEARPGAGTTVTLRLPAAPRSEPEAAGDEGLLLDTSDELLLA